MSILDDDPFVTFGLGDPAIMSPTPVSAVREPEPTEPDTDWTVPADEADERAERALGYRED